MEPLVSIIVPVYNTEQYMDRCMKSLISQTYKNIEIILVDDGSPDNSGALCDAWADNDKRIKIIHKNNGGLASARNAGLNIASGEYVSFVDSDDFASIELIERLLKAIIYNNCDTSMCAYKLFTNENNIENKKNYLPSDRYQSKRILLAITGAELDYALDIEHEMSVWANMYSMNIIKKYNVEFKSEREYMCEDIMFHMEYLKHSEHVALIDDCMYYYCVNGNSLTHKYRKDRWEKEKKLFRYESDELNKIFNKGEFELRLQKFFLGRVRNCILQEVNDSDKSKKNILKAIKTIAEDDVVVDILKSYPYRHNVIQQRIFNACLKYKHIYALYIMSRLKRL